MEVPLTPTHKANMFEGKWEIAGEINLAPTREIVFGLVSGRGLG